MTASWSKIVIQEPCPHRQCKEYCSSVSQIRTHHDQFLTSPDWVTGKLQETFIFDGENNRFLRFPVQPIQKSPSTSYFYVAHQGRGSSYSTFLNRFSQSLRWKRGFTKPLLQQPEPYSSIYIYTHTHNVQRTGHLYSVLYPWKTACESLVVSLEVKISTVWTDGEAEVGRVREQKRRREKIREEKEPAGARKGSKVAKQCVFSMICGSGGSKTRLAKAACAVPHGQIRDETLHAVAVRSRCRSQRI